jgi:hypothetical protein
MPYNTMKASRPTPGGALKKIARSFVQENPGMTLNFIPDKVTLTALSFAVVSGMTRDENRTLTGEMTPS